MTVMKNLSRPFNQIIFPMIVKVSVLINFFWFKKFKLHTGCHTCGSAGISAQ